MKRTLLTSEFKLLVVIGLFLFLTSNVSAQQDPYYTHYAFVKQLYNPAAVGLDGRWCAFGLAHSQYMGLRDQTPLYAAGDGFEPLNEDVRRVGPKTNALAVSIPINKYDKATQTTRNYGGAGISVYDDNLGYETNLNIRGQLAYRHTLNPGHTLALGLEGGLLQKGILGDRLRYIDPGDPNIPTATETDSRFTGSVGLYYQNEEFNNFYAGLSSTNMLPQEYQYGLNGTVRTITTRHYYLLAGMDFESFLGNPMLTLKPSILVKYNAVVQVDAGAMVEMAETFSGGIGYRSITDALSILVGYRTNDLRIGLSYDVTLSRLIRVSNGTFEVFASYCWEFPRTEPTVIPILGPRAVDRERATY